MLADGRTVPDGERISTRICIVGAGPAGITLARRLAQAGVDFVLLERGDRTGTGVLEDLGNAVSTGLHYSVDKARGTGFGGALHKWLVTTPLGEGFGRLREFAPDDFIARSWVPSSGWPFEKHELAEAYREARAWFDVPWPNLDGDRYWDEHVGGGILADGGDVAASIFTFANPGIFAADYLRSLDQAESGLVLTHSCATELRGRTPENIDEVRVATETTSYTVLADVIVLATGAIENARLLLASQQHDASGIGNAHDNVGRYFLEHPRYVSGVIEPSAKLREDPAAWDIHMQDGVPVQRKLRLTPQAAERHQLLNSMYFLRESDWPRPGAMRPGQRRALLAREGARELRMSVQGSRSVTTPGRRLADLAMSPASLVRPSRTPRDAPIRRQPASQQLAIEVMAEQAPNAMSRVTLHRERDRFGVPKAAVDWRLSRLDLEAAARGQARIREHLESRGLGRVHDLVRRRHVPYRLHNADHQMGTTRMHRDPRLGVVDPDGRVHGVPNLFVAGPGVFPTAGDSNPTLTTVAMALRLANHLEA